MQSQKDSTTLSDILNEYHLPFRISNTWDLESSPIQGNSQNIPSQPATNESDSSTRPMKSMPTAEDDIDFEANNTTSERSSENAE